MKRTKIVATIGPASNDEKMIRDLFAAGMNVARLNASHGDLEWHRSAIATLRKVASSIPILLDIPGRKIRTVQLDHEPEFSLGDIVVLTTDQSHDGSEKVPVNYDRLHEDLTQGDVIFADDGTLRFTVVDVVGCDIRLRAETPGILKSRKGINAPAARLGTDLVTERDRRMVAFARENEVDFIGISFVESREHVESIRRLAGGNWPRIVSKIENQRGLEQMGEVIDASDALMIDRGDLSVETNLESLAIYQKQIIEAARIAAKPVIVATEMLHTMIVNNYPTKAEVSDITNAVLDGAAATMLSGETAMGEHPLAAVDVMRRIVDAAEKHLQSSLDISNAHQSSSIPLEMERAIASICRALPITKIVAITKSGYAARTLAAHQVRQPILAVSDDAAAARSFNLLPGVTGIHVDIEFSRDSTDHVIRCVEALWRSGELKASDMILITAVGYPKSGNRMNLIQTHVVSDLVESLGWIQTNRSKVASTGSADRVA